MAFQAFPRGARVEWNPGNKSKTTYCGVVIAHNPSGSDIHRIRGYEQNRAGKAKNVVGFDRVPVKAKHDNMWHAQSLRGLRLTAV